MTLAQIQPHVVSRLQAAAALNGAVVISDDGTWPQTPGREAALNDKGLVLIVWQIQSDALIDTSPTGVANLGVYVPVVIEENVTKNRAAGGAGIVFEAAIEAVMRAVVGSPSAVPPNEPFVLMEPPFRNFGRVNGLQRAVVNFVVHKKIRPS